MSGRDDAGPGPLWRTLDEAAGGAVSRREPTRALRPPRVAGWRAERADPEPIPWSRAAGNA